MQLKKTHDAAMVLIQRAYGERPRFSYFHGLAARTADVDGAGKTLEPAVLPTSYERFAVLVDWVERRIAPGKSLTLTGGARTMPLCSYPEFPKYLGGAASAAASYRCVDR